MRHRSRMHCVACTTLPLNAKPGAWLIVVTPPATLDTFSERRRPTQAELVRGRPEPSGVRPARVRVGDDDAARAEGAEHQHRRGSAKRQFARARCGRQADRSDHRQSGRTVRSSAKTDLRRAGRRERRPFSGSSIASALPASSIPEATTSRRASTRRYSRYGATGSSRSCCVQPVRHDRRLRVRRNTRTTSR